MASLVSMLIPPRKCLKCTKMPKVPKIVVSLRSSYLYSLPKKIRCVLSLQIKIDRIP